MTGPADLPLFTGESHEPPRDSRSPQARRLAGNIHPGRTRRGDSTESPLHIVTEEEVEPQPARADLTGAQVDYSDVREIQGEVSRGLIRGEAGRRLTEAEDGERARHKIRQEITALNQRRVDEGKSVLSPTERAALEQATIDALFGLGRLTPLLELPGLKNLEIRHGGTVWLIFDDGRIESAPPIADGPGELVDLIALLAGSSDSPRPFDRAHPSVDLTLPDGSRLSAQSWFTPYPMVSIRKHLLVDIDLTDLVKRGSVSPSIAAFLTAAVLAGKSILISGLPGAGKTTIARAVLNTLPPTVPLAIVETEDELGLHDLTHRHARVWSGWELVGGGEVVDGHTAGRLTVSEMLPPALRSNAQILVVGEVRGHEAIAMLMAMQAGRNSVSTIHAHSGRDTIDRLVTCVTEYGSHSTTWAYRQAASLVDIIVHAGHIDETHLEGGREHFFIDEVCLPSLSGDSDTGYSVPQLYKPGHDGRAVPDAVQAPDWIPDLVRYGFDPSWLNPEKGGWSKPMTTIISTDGRRQQ